MNAQTIAARIGTAIDGEHLVAMPEPAAALAVRTLGDLLTQWKGGCVLADAGSYLRRPCFAPRPRRSGRPLPAPRPNIASVKPVSARLLASITGAWAYFESVGKTDPALLQGPVAGEGLERLVELLVEEVGEQWPLAAYLEEVVFEAENLAAHHGLCLVLPHMVYEDEAAGVIEAFLSGPQHVHSWLAHSYELMQHEPTFDLELPPKDHSLIKEIGFGRLVETYATYEGEKSVDLKKLESWWETYFGKVVKEFPVLAEEEWPIICGNGGQDAELVITSAKDIRFAVAYSDAYYTMMDDLPDPWQMDHNDDGATETFIHEICEVWRKANGKRSVRWTTPKQQRLSYLYREGKL